MLQCQIISSRVEGPTIRLGLSLTSVIECPFESRTVTGANGPASTGRRLRLVSSSQAVPTVLLSALGMVERFVDATGLKLVGYENRSNQVEPDLLVSVSVVGGVFMDRCELLQGMLVRSFAADPRYASLRLDLCSGGAGKSFCPQSSAAYCKMRLCVTLLGGGRYDVYDVRFNPSLECDGGASSLCVSVSPDAFCVGRIIADLVRCTQDGPNPKWLPSDCREGVG